MKYGLLLKIANFIVCYLTTINLTFSQFIPNGSFEDVTCSTGIIDACGDDAGLIFQGCLPNVYSFSGTPSVISNLPVDCPLDHYGIPYTDSPHGNNYVHIGNDINTGAIFFDLGGFTFQPNTRYNMPFSFRGVNTGPQHLISTSYVHFYGSVDCQNSDGSPSSCDLVKLGSQLIPEDNIWYDYTVDLQHYCEIYNLNQLIITQSYSENDSGGGSGTCGHIDGIGEISCSNDCSILTIEHNLNGEADNLSSDCFATCFTPSLTNPCTGENINLEDYDVYWTIIMPDNSSHSQSGSNLDFCAELPLNGAYTLYLELAPLSDFDVFCVSNHNNCELSYDPPPNYYGEAVLTFNVNNSSTDQYFDAEIDIFGQMGRGESTVEFEIIGNFPVPIKSFIWSFGDGEVFETPNRSTVHRYPSGNKSYEVCVYAVDFCGRITKPFCKEIYVQCCYSDSEIEVIISECHGEFNANETGIWQTRGEEAYSFYLNPYTYPPFSPRKSISYDFDKIGLYTVCFIPKGEDAFFPLGDGCQSRNCKNFLVDNCMSTCSSTYDLEAEFSFSNSTCDSYSFQNLSASRDPLISNSWWDMGDGTIYNGTNYTNHDNRLINHNFFKNGSFDVCLTVKNTENCYDQKCETITISCFPEDFDCESTCEVDFKYNSKNCSYEFKSDVEPNNLDVTYSWTINGIPAGNDPDLVSLLPAGSYDVCLKINNPFDCDKTICKTVVSKGCDVKEGTIDYAHVTCGDTDETGRGSKLCRICFNPLIKDKRTIIASLWYTTNNPNYPIWEWNSGPPDNISRLIQGPINLCLMVRFSDGSIERVCKDWTCADIPEEIKFRSSTNTKDKHDGLLLSVFPTPSYLFVQFTTNINKPMKSLQVYDVNGKLVSEINKINSSEYTWHRNNLPSGVYIATLYFEEGKVSKKLIIE